MLRKIQGVVKHYDWGGYDFLPDLLNLKKTGKPFAEYWLGTHPDGNAVVLDKMLSLSEYLQATLPFLFKILDVREMLSIQVHPNKKSAERGFSQEERSGKSRNAYNRVFKDDNHKPELMVALSDFWLVQGFQSEKDIIATFRKNPELKPIGDYLTKNGLEKTYAHLMTMPQEEVNSILKPLGQRIKPLYSNHELAKEDINFWAARAYFTFNKAGVCDRGIFSLYLMNLLRLNSGEGVYQAPGVLHAYLEGQNVECMAASDNVVRGGLTSKYIDTDQLLSMLKFESTIPQIVPGDQDGIYQTPASEFALQKIVGGDKVAVKKNSLVINLGSSVSLLGDSGKSELGKGQAALADKDELLNISKLSNEESEIFIASGNDY